MGVTVFSAAAVVLAAMTALALLQWSHRAAVRVTVAAALANLLLFGAYVGRLSSVASWVAFWQAAPLLVFGLIAAAALRRQTTRPVLVVGLNVSALMLSGAALVQSGSTFWVRRFAPHLGEPNVTWLLGPFRIAFLIALAFATLAVLWLLSRFLPVHPKPAA
jgi:hypothetical protein